MHGRLCTLACRQKYQGRDELPHRFLPSSEVPPNARIYTSRIHSCCWNTFALRQSKSHEHQHQLRCCIRGHLCLFGDFLKSITAFPMLDTGDVNNPTLRSLQDVLEQLCQEEGPQEIGCKECLQPIFSYSLIFQEVATSSIVDQNIQTVKLRQECFRKRLDALHFACVQLQECHFAARYLSGTFGHHCFGFLLIAARIHNVETIGCE
mmetsp:Transcript_154/g.233  ORF Transcript_154/g.233 Transcript_154/m.233 type:complete len:207 (+) Transcript_154:335-955(+)